MVAPVSLPAVSHQAQGSALRNAATICAGLVLLVAWEIGGLDLPLARLYGSAQGFVWRDHWLTGVAIRRRIASVGGNGGKRHAEVRHGTGCGFGAEA